MNFREANEEFIVTQMNRFASYINHLCEFVKLYKKEYEELCIRNNKNPNTLAKDKSIIEYERGMKESYDTALDIYNYLKDLRDRNREGENVLDVFGGSGSTLIACEQLNRNCYMMELDPYYCQVIINRWEEYTGQKAEKLPL